MRIGSNNIEDTGRDNLWPRYDYLTFYNRVLPTPLKEKKYPYYITFCPFHNDKNNPNLSINILSGRYKCWACSARGSAYDFIVKSSPDGSSYVFDFPDHIKDADMLKKIEEYEDSKEYKQETEELILAVEEQRAQKAHEFLFQQPFALTILQRDRGLTIESIKKWKLGWMKGTVTIPIYDIFGKIANLKFHKKFSTEYAKNQLFPWGAVTRSDVAFVNLVEGEFDTMITRQHGFNAVTQTFGANTWDDSLSYFFRKKTVFIAYDNDDAGKNASLEVGKQLWRNGTNVYIIRWPEFMTTKEDHVDFFVKYRQSASDYRRLINNATSIIQI